MAKAEMKVETVVHRDIVLTLSLNEAVYLKTLFGRYVGGSCVLTESICKALEDARVPSCDTKEVFAITGLYVSPVANALSIIAEKVRAFYG